MIMMNYLRNDLKKDFKNSEIHRKIRKFTMVSFIHFYIVGGYDKTIHC